MLPNDGLYRREFLVEQEQGKEKQISHRGMKRLMVMAASSRPKTICKCAREGKEEVIRHPQEQSPLSNRQQWQPFTRY